MADEIVLYKDVQMILKVKASYDGYYDLYQYFRENNPINIITGEMLK